MKVFKNPVSATASMAGKEKYYLNSTCPYSPESRVCGSWCALFYLEEAVDTKEQKTSGYVILGCKAGEKHLYINKIVED